MLFNSWIFAVYLVTVLAVYYALNRRWQNVFLLVCSYVFYGWWDYRFCGLIALSSTTDFLCSLGLEKTDSPRKRKLILLISCLVNLGVLGFFKYFNFFLDSFDGLFALAGMRLDVPTMRIILPVGISFYTFQTLSYTIVVYRRRMKPTHSYVDFLLFVSFFPQLVAGPIERACDLLPQLSARRTVTPSHLTSGAVLILIGLFRKIAIADAVAPIVTEIFANPAQYGSLQLLVGLYLFSIQIYCDFAGYSDIARGAARLLGVELMENFQHPYFSRNITEFWRRWHVSLSSWLRDYLYIPLGGNRVGRVRTYGNLMLTMLLGGLWHGASWTFVIWGGLHGAYLAIHKLLLGERKPEFRNRWPQRGEWPRELAKVLVTFHLVCLTWIFFRSATFAQAWTYLSGILVLRGGWPEQGFQMLLATGVLLLLIDVPQYRRVDHTVVLTWHWLARGAAYAGMVLVMFALRSNGEIPFIYFQF